MSGHHWMAWFACTAATLILILLGDIHSAAPFAAASTVIAALGRRA